MARHGCASRILHAAVNMLFRCLKSSRPGSALSCSSALALLALSLVTSPTTAQISGAAGIGATSTPQRIGPFDIDAGASVNRIGSTVRPRTTLDLESTIDLPMSHGSGVWLGLTALTVREVDSLPVRPLLEGGLWRTFSRLTVGVGVATHVARLGGRAPGWHEVRHDVQIRLPNGALFDSSYTLTEYDSGGRSRPRLWSDLETTASWRVRQLRLDAVIGARRAVDSTRRSIWGRLTTTASLSSRSMLVGTIGRQPAQLAFGVPASNFASLSVSVFAPRRHGPLDTVAVSGASSPFSVRADGPGQYTVACRLPGARRVELSGDFDSWKSVEMRETAPGLWTARLSIAPGTYHMNVRVDDGAWTAPPGVTPLRDEFDGTVGIVIVR